MADRFPDCAFGDRPVRGCVAHAHTGAGAEWFVRHGSCSRVPDGIHGGDGASPGVDQGAVHPDRRCRPGVRHGGPSDVWLGAGLLCHRLWDRLVVGGGEMLAVGSILYASLPLNAYLAVLSRWDADHQAQRTARLGILANTLAALARVVCILAGADLRWAAFTIVLEVVISAAVAIGWSVKKGWGADLLSWDRQVARTLLCESLPLFLSHSGTLLLLRADQLMIYHIRGASEAGVYAAATRLSEIVYATGPMMIMTFMPILSRSFQSDPGKYQRQCAWLFGALSLIAYGSIAFWWLAGGLVVRLLYGDAFEQAAMVLLVHGIAALPYLHGELRSSVLVIERKTVWSVRCAVFGLVINVLLNLWLVPVHGALGAAWATAIAYTLVWFFASLVVPALRPIGRQQVAGLMSPVWLWREFRQWRTLMS